MATLAAAQSVWDGLNLLPNRTATQRQRADAELVMALATALAEASRNIDDVLLRARDFWGSFAHARSDDDAIHYEVRRMSVRFEYVADRFAKLILDLVVRALAALETRPLSASLRPRESTKIALAWSTVDECLLKALRTLFNRGAYRAKGEAGRLFEVQYYLTYVSLLHNRLQMWRAASALGDRAPNGERREYFKETEDWLQERVESERMHGASSEEAESYLGIDDTARGVHDRAPTPGAPAAPPVIPATGMHTTPGENDRRNDAVRSEGIRPQAEMPSAALHPDAREMIMQGRANATYLRMGTYRRSSTYSSGGHTPNSSQESMASRPTVSGGINPGTLQTGAHTVRESQSRRGRRASQLSISSEATPWPSDADSDNEVYNAERAARVRRGGNVRREGELAVNPTAVQEYIDACARATRR